MHYARGLFSIWAVDILSVVVWEAHVFVQRCDPGPCTSVSTQWFGLPDQGFPYPSVAGGQLDSSALAESMLCFVNLFSYIFIPSCSGSSCASSPHGMRIIADRDSPISEYLSITSVLLE